MNTNQISIALVCLLFFHFQSFGQSEHQFGALPFLNVNKEIGKGFELNFKAETRQVAYRESEFAHQHELVDLTVLAAMKASLNSSVAVGYLLRFEDGAKIHRTIQQWSIIQNSFSFKVSHRFVSDQTFEQAEDVAFRLRYRIAGLIPLNGQEANAREVYLKASNEYLNEFQNEDYGLEVRFNLTIGYKISDDSKVELGAESRIDSFVNEAHYRNRAWMTIGWYVRI